MEVRKFGSPKIVYSFSPTPTSVFIAGKLFIPFFFLYIFLICVVPPSRTRAAHHRPVPVLLGTTGLHARRTCAALAGHPPEVSRLQHRVALPCPVDSSPGLSTTCCRARGLLKPQRPAAACCSGLPSALLDPPSRPCTRAPSSTHERSS